MPRHGSLDQLFDSYLISHVSKQFLADKATARLMHASFVEKGHFGLLFWAGGNLLFTPLQRWYLRRRRPVRVFDLSYWHLQ